MQRNKFRLHGTYVEGFAFLLGSVLLGAYSLVLHVASKAVWKMSPYLFPLVIAFFLFVLSLSLLEEGRKERQALEATKLQEQTDETDANPNSASIWRNPWKDAIVFALIALVYIMSITIVGFVISTFLFLVASFVYLKERRVWLIALLSIAFPLFVYVLFGMLLHVMLP